MKGARATSLPRPAPVALDRWAAEAAGANRPRRQVAGDAPHTDKEKPPIVEQPSRGSIRSHLRSSEADLANPQEAMLVGSIGQGARGWAPTLGIDGHHQAWLSWSATGFEKTAPPRLK
jgi:hypothetical protein